MHGHAPMTPPRRPGPPAGVIAVRVTICALMVLTCGFLAWVGMLRIAIMRRGGRDWALFWAQLALNIACLATLEQRLADHWISNVGMAGLLVQMAAVTAYYLVVDVRHHRPAPALAPYGPGYGPYGYGYRANAAMTVSQPPPVPQAPPVSPQAAPRIEQVRAELDELSDLLRKDPRDPRDTKDPREGGR
ncbi:hypothetical protein ACF06X_22860 [Streptomyces sp. NPDC015346]|uniref:hypothetical protein n=1 Tax=Streptomyces sp. NPDC015346 TaxID=3364954 RepID=UPI0036F81EE5